MAGPRTIHVVDDDDAVRDGLAFLLEASGYAVRTFETARALLDSGEATRAACLITDVRMPGLSGLDLAAHLKARDARTPVIVITGHADVAQAIKAIQVGAFDFIEKPFDDAVLIAAVERALGGGPGGEVDGEAVQRLRSLTIEECEVLDKLVEGATDRAIAEDLALDHRDVALLRASIMGKLQAGSLPELIRVTLIAGRST